MNSVTWIDSVNGANTPAALYIERMKATHVVDLPSLYSQSSRSGMVSSWLKDRPRLSVSVMIP